MILDETHDFLSQHVAAEPAQLDAMVLYAAATHGIRAGVTFGRMLFTSEQEESGKTLAMTVTATLSSNPIDVAGSVPAMHAAMAQATNEPERPVPTFYIDEISDVFGKSGLTGNNNPIAEILRKGYKRGATLSWSVARMQEKYSIYTPFLMTGLRTAVPRDIRSRCIVIKMAQGKPARYFDAREAESYAVGLRNALHSHVGAKLDVIKAFRARGIHPKLTNRKLEVWEPLIATAFALGGQPWLDRAIAAFAALALDQSDTLALTPAQQVIRDVAHLAERHRAGTAAQRVPGLWLCDELSRSDNPIYAERSIASIACLIRDSVPVDSVQWRDGDVRTRGYLVADLLAVWEQAKPQASDETEVPDEANPFEDTAEGDQP